MLRKLYELIAGPHSLFRFEHRIFNLSTFILCVFCVQGTLINFLLGLHPATVWLAVIGTFISTGIFFLARIRGRFNRMLLMLFVVASVAVLGPLHFFNGASIGPTIYLLVMMLTIFILIAPTTLQFFIYGVYAVSITGMLLLEYYQPSWVVVYNSDEQRITDHATVLLYSMFFTVLVIWLFRRSYDREQRTIMLQKKELEQLYSEARQKNKYIESLIRELHHRVKNNLQVVSSLMSLQSNRVEDEHARMALEESKTRVDAMAMIHQKLYVDHELAAVNMQDYLHELAVSLVSSFGLPAAAVHTTVQLHNPSMNIDKAVSIGLIVNELVTNACKHAFKAIPDPKLFISLEQDATHLQLCIADNGIGLKKNAATESGFGLKLVHILVNQLDAAIEMHNQEGTRYNIQMKAE